MQAHVSKLQKNSNPSDTESETSNTSQRIVQIKSANPIKNFGVISNKGSCMDESKNESLSTKIKSAIVQCAGKEKISKHEGERNSGEKLSKAQQVTNSSNKGSSKEGKCYQFVGTVADRASEKTIYEGEKALRVDSEKEEENIREEVKSTKAKIEEKSELEKETCKERSEVKKKISDAPAKSLSRNVTSNRSTSKGNNQTNDNTVLKQPETDKKEQKEDMKDVQNLEGKETSEVSTGKTGVNKKKQSSCSSILPPYKSEEFKKQKTYNITPASSFPLDELLPVPKQQNKVDNKNASKVPTDGFRLSCDQLEPHEQPLNPTIYGQEVSYQTIRDNYIKTSQASEYHQNLLYGTVYGLSAASNPVLSDMAYSQYQEYPETNSFVAESHRMSHFVNRNIGDIMNAIQSGNPEIISTIQDALYSEIGLNLQTLAATVKSQTVPMAEPKGCTPRGFYQERSVADDSLGLPDHRGVSRGAEASCDMKQSQELFCLFVEQCNDLVQTEEDKEKLMSLVKVLKKESGISLANTGFTPPHINKLDEREYKTEAKPKSEIAQESPVSTPPVTSASNYLFEGRTMLKGGVKPRHIPKTTVHKLGVGRPIDPRPFDNQKPSTGSFILLPPFAREMWGEVKIRQIIELGNNTSLPKSKHVLNSCYNPHKVLQTKSKENTDNIKAGMIVVKSSKPQKEESDKVSDRKLTKANTPKEMKNQKESKNPNETSNCMAKVSGSSKKACADNDKIKYMVKKDQCANKPTVAEKKFSSKITIKQKPSLDERITSCNLTKFSTESWTPVTSFSYPEEPCNIPVVISKFGEGKDCSENMPNSFHSESLIHVKTVKMEGNATTPEASENYDKVRNSSVHNNLKICDKSPSSIEYRNEITAGETEDKESATEIKTVKLNDKSRERSMSIEKKVNTKKVSRYESKPERHSRDQSCRKAVDKQSVENQMQVGMKSMERKDRKREHSLYTDKNKDSNNLNKSKRSRHSSVSSVDSSAPSVKTERDVSRHRHQSSIAIKSTQSQEIVKPTKPVVSNTAGVKERKRHCTTHETHDKESKKRKYDADPDEKRRYSYGDTREQSKSCVIGEGEKSVNSIYFGKITYRCDTEQRQSNFSTNDVDRTTTQYFPKKQQPRGQAETTSKFDNTNIDLKNSNTLFTDDKNYKCSKKSEHKKKKVQEEMQSEGERKVVFRDTGSACSSSEAALPKMYVEAKASKIAARPKADKKALEDDRKFLEGFKKRLSGDKLPDENNGSDDTCVTNTSAQLAQERKDRLFLESIREKAKKNQGKPGTAVTSSSTGSQGRMPYNDMLNLADLEDI